MPTHITDDGCRLAFEWTGPDTAPPLVLSNSLGTNRRLWDDQMAALSTRFHVLRYDTRGHGASDAPAGDYTLARLGRDVVSLMDQAGVPQADVAGISIGGLTALWLGIYAPERVHRLVLANTAARIGSLDMWTDRMRMVESRGVAALADATMDRWFTPAFRAANDATVSRIRATFLATPAIGYLGCCAALRDADLRRDAITVRVPALVITGTHDPATPAAEGAWLAAAISGSELVELDAAHLSNVERPDDFTNAMVRFLSV